MVKKLIVEVFFWGETDQVVPFLDQAKEFIGAVKEYMVNAGRFQRAP